MSLQWDLPRKVPEDTAALGQKLLAPDNAYRQIGDQFAKLFPDQGPFVPLYYSTGRGAIPPLLLALVTILQMLEKVSDRVAAEWVVSRLDWKYALHLLLDYPGFHFTDLYAFRQRLLEHEEERLVFDELLAKLKALGLLKSRSNMRTDSTHILALVERLNQFELVTETIRVTVEAMDQAASTWSEATLPAIFREAYGQRQSTFGRKEHEIAAQLQKAGQDGFWLLVQVDQSGPTVVRELQEVAVLRQVLAQQFPGGPSQPPAARRPGGGEIIESPHEPEARCGTKRDQHWIGYKAQVTETCEPDQPRLMTDIDVTSAVAHDSPELPPIQKRLEERGLRPSEHMVDQGYVSGEHIVKSQAQGIDLVGPPPADTHPDNGFRQTDFQVDVEAKQVICPVGEVSRVWSERASAEGEPPTIEVRFSAETCQACPAFGVCTKSAQGRSLELNPYRSALEARRVEAQTETFKQRFRIRAGVEATISELVRGHGLRRARSRGRAKMLLQACFTAAAVNLKRVMRWWAQSCAQAQTALAAQVPSLSSC